MSRKKRDYDIIKLYNDGMLIPRIKEKLNLSISLSRIVQITRKSTMRSSYNSKLDSDIVHKMVKMRGNMTQKNIGIYLNCSQYSVCKYLKLYDDGYFNEKPKLDGFFGVI